MQEQINQQMLLLQQHALQQQALQQQLLQQNQLITYQQQALQQAQIQAQQVLDSKIQLQNLGLQQQYNMTAGTRLSQLAPGVQMIPQNIPPQMLLSTPNNMLTSQTQQTFISQPQQFIAPQMLYSGIHPQNMMNMSRSTKSSFIQ